MGIEGFLPIASSLIHIHENSEPKVMMKNGLKNCVIAGGISQSMKPIYRFTFPSANSVKEVPACSKAAQKMMLMTIMMVNAIIRSLQTPPSFTPAEINWKTTKIKMAINKIN